jgi:hypothetical protein
MKSKVFVMVMTLGLVSTIVALTPGPIVLKNSCFRSYPKYVVCTQISISIICSTLV